MLSVNDLPLLVLGVILKSFHYRKGMKIVSDSTVWLRHEWQILMDPLLHVTLAQPHCHPGGLNSSEQSSQNPLDFPDP